MTARVGDQISSVEELDALPEGAVVLDSREEVLHLIDSGEALIWSDVWTNECHVGLPATVLYVPGKPSRPPVTDDARAEALAKERYPLREETNYHAGLYRGFLEGWAASRAETTTATTEETP